MILFPIEVEVCLKTTKWSVTCGWDIFIRLKSLINVSANNIIVRTNAHSLEALTMCSVKPWKIK